MSFRVFSRRTWRANSSWPEGYEPNAVPMDECRTIQSFNTRQDAVDYCEDKNHKWRKHSDRVRFKTASEAQRRMFYISPRYEWTEV